MSDLQFRVLTPDDREAILAFENARLEAEIPDPMERSFKSWQARWRPEALDHYLPLGWSFIAYKESAPSEFCGYFLAQPLLFHQGLTQSLWVEHVCAGDATVQFALVDLVCRFSREKHLQRVVFAEVPGLTSILENFKGELVTEAIIEVKTTKYQ